MVASALIFVYRAWFWVVPLLGLVAAVLWLASSLMARRRLGRFFSPAVGARLLTGVDRRRKALRYAATALILALLATALARPAVGPKPGPEGERKGADLVIVLDVSKSMWVEDVPPNRLEAVKQALREWIAKQNGDRVGLVLFAGDAFVQAPLTFDMTALDFVLREAGPGSITKGGSNLSEGIDTAARMLSHNAALDSKVVLLVSDGENLEGDMLNAATQAHQRDGITIFTVGVGTAEGGRVPAYDVLKNAQLPVEKRQKPAYVRNEYGGEAISRLDSRALRNIATAGGGAYYEFWPREHVFDTIRDRSITPLVEKNRKIDLKDYDEWFQIPLAVAILLMVAECLIDRLRRPVLRPEPGVPVVKPVSYSKPLRGRVSPRRAAGTAVLLAVLALALEPVTRADTPVPPAVDELLVAGKNDEAVRILHGLAEQHPEDPYLTYNYGMVLYRVGRLDEAVPVFESVVSLSRDVDLRAQAEFQLGNIHYRFGDALQADRQNALGSVRAFEEALSNYDTGIQMNSTRDTRHNREIACRQLVTVLLAIGKERTRANTEKTLHEALQAYERATELDAANKPLADDARRRLAEMLAQNAGQADKTVDDLESNAKSLPDALKDLLTRRTGILSKLEEASGLQPDNQDFKTAVRRQQQKTADLLTRAVGQKIAPVLQKERFFSSGDFRGLKDASEKMEQAVALDPDNTAASKLNDTIHTKLAEAYVENGEFYLGHLKKSMAADKQAADAAGASDEPKEQPRDSTPAPDADKDAASAAKTKTANQMVHDEEQLQGALSAGDAFAHALGLDPKNVRAQKGLDEVDALLPELHAKVGNENLESAQKQLAGTSLASPPPGQDNSNTQAGQSARPGGATAPSESTLRNVSATLDKSLLNLTAATDLRPDNQDYQNSLKKAEDLMASVRDELAKIEAAKGEGAAGQGTDATAGEGEGQGDSSRAGQGTSTMLSLSGLRGKPGHGGSQGGDSRRYWDRYVRDW